MRVPTATGLALLLLAGPLSGQRIGQVATTAIDSQGSARLIVSSGGTVQISAELRTVSRLSTLSLQWYYAVDSSLGLVFDGPVGARGSYDGSLGGHFEYSVPLRLGATKEIVAFEVRVLTFDIWGRFTGTLALSHLEDLHPGQEKNFPRVWGYLSEGRVRDHFTSIAYVARVKLADGTVIVADPTLVLRAAQRIQGSVTLQDLDPIPEPLPSSATRA